MFDFGFTELMLIAVVALIVVGPERLPKVARSAGHLLGRLQRYVSDVKSDISREMQLEDLKKLQQEVQQQARDLETSVRSQMNEVEVDLKKTASELEKDVAISNEDVSPVDKIANKASSRDAKPPMPGSAAIPAHGGGGDKDLSAQVDADSSDSGPQLELGLDRAAADKQPVEKQ